jgi:hypothetical protein
MKIRLLCTRFAWTRAVVAGFALFVALSIPGCRSVSSPNISEISLGNGGGQMAFWYKIVFRKDGSAEYLGDVPPEMRRGAANSGNRGVERVKYYGKISATQFDELVRLINANGFFLLKDDYGGVMGAVQTTTTVLYDGGRKEVSNQIGQGGEKLSEIERAIDRAADEIKWTKSDR